MPDINPQALTRQLRGLRMPVTTELALQDAEASE